MRARFIALFISCLSLSAAMGQSAGNGTVKGFLRSKPDNQPLPFSAVMLQNPKDSSVAYSAVSNDKGFFQISGIADGEYRFVATYLGYAPLERNINISRGARTQDFGVIGYGRSGNHPQPGDRERRPHSGNGETGYAGV
jgi:hypothetical protein